MTVSDPQSTPLSSTQPARPTGQGTATSTPGNERSGNERNQGQGNQGQGNQRQAEGAGSERPGNQRNAAGLDADRLVDEIVPEQVDWENLVRSYPKPALIAAAGLGFYIALRQGPTLVAALSGFAAQEMTRRVNDFLGSDVL